MRSDEGLKKFSGVGFNCYFCVKSRKKYPYHTPPYRTLNKMTRKEFLDLIDETGKAIIPYGATEIGEGAFYRCADLTSIEIPNSVKKIGKDAFDCPDLIYMKVPKDTEIVNEAFYVAKHVKIERY